MKQETREKRQCMPPRPNEVGTPIEVKKLQPVQELVKALKNGDESEQKQATEELEERGASVVPALIEALKDDEVKITAAGLLGDIVNTNSELFDMIVEILRNGKTPNERHGAALTILKISWDEHVDSELLLNAVPVLADSLKDADFRVRAIAAIPIGNVGRDNSEAPELKAAVPLLKEAAMNDEDENVRNNANQALESITPARPEDSETMDDSLVEKAVTQLKARKERMQNSDGYARFFHEQLDRTLLNFNGETLAVLFGKYDVLEQNLGYFEREVLWSLEKARIFEPGADYSEELGKLTKQERELLGKCERKAAEVGGVDKLGIARLIRRVPVIFYFLRDEPFDDLFFPPSCKVNDHIEKEEKIAIAQGVERGRLEIGLCPEVLKGYKWSHGSGGLTEGIYLGPFHYKVPVETMSIHEFVEQEIQEEIQSAFSGVLYQGFDAQGNEKILLFIDTSEAAQVVEDYPKIADRCAELAERYGIDDIYTLFASKNILGRARLDVSDGEYTDLQMKNIQEATSKVREQWEKDTFMRMLVQSFVKEGKLTSRDPDPEQSIRDLIRARIEMTMQRRMHDYLERSNK